ncbi:nucleoside phosphorylase domain-containing protein [Aspergillus pseudocaelatus]|uniref:Nucleoside phosphorylase domain-containing protein n=1 Tax=Aspergillus pseudocaelatus TaxID=1825620 RepID=A0ABQ6WA07_9EURO|nr:nucleoside phosphorylase domain-containing protein [Aspergillus pseudocaelatus]
MRRKRSHDLRHDYTVGWVCALPHGGLVTGGEDNIYTLGHIDEHNIVIACLPEGQMGTNPAAAAAARMQSAFPSIRFGLMVGIGGGVPSTKPDIRLGDVVVSRPENDHAGVVQYDFGKSTPSGFKRTGQFSKYIREFAHHPAFTRDHAGPDVLFKSHYNHVGGTTCEGCDRERILGRPARDQLGPEIHYGTITYGNHVMRERDRVSSLLGGVLCFEMEAAGLINEFPCLVIRGICVYSDSHKNKTWQPYAAGVAAAYSKELLSVIPPLEVRQSPVVGKIADKPTTRQRNPELSVFWVYVGNAARYEQAYRDLANELGLPGRDDPTVDILKIESQWLSDNTSGQWLMILDNADNEDLFTQEIEVGMRPNSPNTSARALLITSITHTANGSVIITSRNSTAARKLLGIHDNIIPVDVMDEASALDLLQTKVTLDEQSLIDARRLLQDLEYIPLAVIQAGSYIQERSPRITVGDISQNATRE